MLDPATFGLVASGVVVGAVSAVTPFLPVEAYVVSVGATHPLLVSLAAAVTAATGQTCGKLLIFSTARGVVSARWVTRLRSRGAASVDQLQAVLAGAGASDTTYAPPPRTRWRVRERVRHLNGAALAVLSSPKGALVVLLSSSIGFPPLLAVSFYAGASTIDRRTFVLMCLVGRSFRFAALAGLPQLFKGPV